MRIVTCSDVSETDPGMIFGGRLKNPQKRLVDTLRRKNFSALCADLQPPFKKVVLAPEKNYFYTYGGCMFGKTPTSPFNPSEIWNTCYFQK